MERPAITGTLPVQCGRHTRAITSRTEVVNWSTSGGSLVLHVDSALQPQFWLEVNLTIDFLKARLAELEAKRPHNPGPGP